VGLAALVVLVELLGQLAGQPLAIGGNDQIGFGPSRMQRSSAALLRP
jgi:hypothetical protein